MDSSENGFETEVDETTNIKVKWKNAPKLEDLKEDYKNALPAHTKQQTTIREYLDALEIKGSHAITKKKGSKVQPKLIRKQAEWRYSALSEPFLATDQLFSGKPKTAEDVESAKQNSMVLNHQFENELNKVKFINEYVRAATNEGTVIVRTGWKFDSYLRTIDSPVFSIIPMDQNNQDHVDTFTTMQEMVENNSINLVEDAEIVTAFEFTQRTGIPHIPTILEYEEIEEEVITCNRPTVEVCNSENVIIDPSCGGNYEDAKFVIYSFESSYSDLKNDPNYTNLDAVNWMGQSILSTPDHATESDESFNFKDKARKKVVVREYWGYWDVEGDGKLLPFVSAWIGDTMVRLQESPFPDRKLPFTFVSYLPIIRSIFGETDGSLLVDNQKIVGAITRGAIDTMARAAAGQRGIRQDALDVNNRRKFLAGQDYEFNSNVDPRSLLHVHDFPELPSSIYNMIAMQNNDAESMSGVKAFSTGGITGDSLGANVGGIKTALDATAKREMDILRRLKQGIIEIGYKIAAMNAEFLSEEEVIRITNEEFVTISRESLVGKFDLDLDISTPEEEQRKADDISFMLQTLGNNIDPKVTYRLLSEVATLRKMPLLAKDLREYKPEPDPMAQEKAMLEIELLKAQIAEVHSKTAENYAEAQESQAKAASAVKDVERKDLDYVQEESGVNQARDLEKISRQAESQAETKIVEKQLENLQFNSKTKNEE